MTINGIERADRVGPVHHASARVWCGERGESAVISIIERAETGSAGAFVLWCSLRACEKCSERCLRQSVLPRPVGPASCGGAAGVPPAASASSADGEVDRGAASSAAQ